MDNIQNFNRTVGTVLAELFKRFPQRWRLAVTDICMNFDFSVERYDALTDHERSFTYDTLLWLVDFGFITGDKMGWGLSESTLTPTGLALMNTTISTETRGLQTGSYGKSLLRAFADNAQDQLAELGGKALAEYTKAVMR